MCVVSASPYPVAHGHSYDGSLVGLVNKFLAIILFLRHSHGLGHCKSQTWEGWVDKSSGLVRTQSRIGTHTDLLRSGSVVCIRFCVKDNAPSL